MSPHPEANSKADPSANALTHGLTARRLLGETEAELMRVTVDSWMGKHYPETPSEEALVATAAIEYVRYLRCVRAEEASLIPGVRRALREWRQQRQHAIRRRAQDLKTDPEAVIEEFHESAFGIDWMLRRWKHLRQRLDSPQFPWNIDDLTSAMQLLGHSLRPPTEAGSDASLVWMGTYHAFPKLFDPKTDRPGDPAALQHLKTVFTNQIERLEALRPQVWAEFDLPEADAIEAAGLVDTTKEGQLRQRYRREACRDYQKSLNDLNRMRNERSKTNARETKLMNEANAHRPERPAYVPPAQQQSPAGSRNEVPQEVRAPLSQAPPADSRNEARSQPESNPESQRNPNQGNEICHTAPDAVSSPEQRTGPRTEGRTDDPRQHPDAPSEAPNHASNAPDRSTNAPDRA